MNLNEHLSLDNRQFYRELEHDLRNELFVRAMKMIELKGIEGEFPDRTFGWRLTLIFIPVGIERTWKNLRMWEIQLTMAQQEYKDVTMTRKDLLAHMLKELLRLVDERRDVTPIDLIALVIPAAERKVLHG